MSRLKILLGTQKQFEKPKRKKVKVMKHRSTWWVTENFSITLLDNWHFNIVKTETNTGVFIGPLLFRKFRDE